MSLSAKQEITFLGEYVTKVEYKPTKEDPRRHRWELTIFNNIFAGHDFHELIETAARWYYEEVNDDEIPEEN